MTLDERVFLYCERGTNEALWAEPINAISNAGFFLAALIFWQLLLWRPPEQRNPDHYLLIALVFAIGFGSLAFHLYADQGTALADVIPIGIFMLVYLGFVLNRFLGVPPGWTVFLAVVFAGLAAAATQIHCWSGGVGFADIAPEGSKVCLNGSVGYLPALAALIVVGMLLAERGHKAAPYVLAATLVFAASIVFRSIDLSYCDQVVVEGRNVGTHFIWHILNALVLFLLLRATLEAGVKASPAEAAAVPAPVAEKPAEPEPVKAEPEKAEEPEPETDEPPKDEDKAPEPEEAPQETPEEPKADPGTNAEPSDDSPKDDAPPDKESVDAAAEGEASEEDEGNEPPGSGGPKSRKKSK